MKLHLHKAITNGLTITKCTLVSQITHEGERNGEKRRRRRRKRTWRQKKTERYDKQNLIDMDLESKRRRGKGEKRALIKIMPFGARDRTIGRPSCSLHAVNNLDQTALIRS